MIERCYFKFFPPSLPPSCPNRLSATPVTGVVGHLPSPNSTGHALRDAEEDGARRRGRVILTQGPPADWIRPFCEGGDSRRGGGGISYPSRGWFQNVLHSHNRGTCWSSSRRKIATTTRRSVLQAAPRHRARFTILVASKCGALADEIKLD